MPEVKVGVGIAVSTPKGFVLLRRLGSHGAGEWCMPGGGLEFGETIIECAIRETLEETGLNLKNPVQLPFTTEERYPGKQYVTVYVLGSAEGPPRIMEQTKASEIMLITPGSELPKPRFGGIVETWKWIEQNKEKSRFFENTEFDPTTVDT